MLKTVTESMEARFFFEKYKLKVSFCLVQAMIRVYLSPAVFVKTASPVYLE